MTHDVRVCYLPRYGSVAPWSRPWLASCRTCDGLHDRFLTEVEADQAAAAHTASDVRSGTNG